MPRRQLGLNVFEAATERLASLYRSGHTVVCSFSGGKDSTAVLELAVIAARREGCLPVDVIIQDEEVAYPGTYEFVDQTAQRPEVRMHWLVMQQPMLNVFNRALPYFWVLDPLLDPDEWVRKPPAYAEFVKEKAIELMANPHRFPGCLTPRRTSWGEAPEGKKLVCLIGLRVEESPKRAMGLHASGGWVCNSNDLGTFNARPIYDWKESDVWKFLRDNKCAYNRAYDVLHKMGTRRMRIGPPTMTAMSIEQLSVASRAWPQWFDRVCRRVPGVRTAVLFGRRACQPNRQHGETWEKCFYRECLGANTPTWIRERSQLILESQLRRHAQHSAGPIPEVVPCKSGCDDLMGSWRSMARAMWSGDPYCFKTTRLEMVEPEFFRPGSGTWAGDWAKITGKKIKVMF